MTDFDIEYRALFETPLEEIKEDIFFRTDNFQNEEWYNELTIYLAIGVCRPDEKDIAKLQKALKILGYPTQTKEIKKQLYIVPL